MALFTPEFADKLRKHYNIQGDLFNPHGGEDHEVEIRVGNDILLTSQGYATSYYQSLTEDYTDEWGVGFKIVEYVTENGTGHYTEPEGHPLADDKAVNTYKPPDPKVEKRYEPSKKLVEDYGKEYAIMGVIPCTIFETAWALRGYDKLLVDLITNEELANQILDIPFEYHLFAGKKLAELGVDIIWTGDDVGGQNAMLMAPDIWRKYFKNRMARLFSEFKSINSNIKIAYHSDGNISPIIDDLVEIGLDILNPIQPKSMDPYYLKKRYGKSLSFWGSIDIQETLPFGTTEEVESETKERIKYLGPGGGFIIGPAQIVQLDTTLNNFFACWDSIDKYGTYPINL